MVYVKDLKMSYHIKVYRIGRKYMKKLVSLSLLSLMLASCAIAEEYTFEPVEISTTPSSSSKAVSAQDKDVQTIKALSEISDSNNERFQNALLELDSVQVDMRDKLLEYKNQYSEIDAQYNKYRNNAEHASCIYPIVKDVISLCLDALLMYYIKNNIKKDNQCRCNI